MARSSTAQLPRMGRAALAAGYGGKCETSLEKTEEGRWDVGVGDVFSTSPSSQLWAISGLGQQRSSGLAAYVARNVSIIVAGLS
jgi:hypothetical protein